MATAISYETVRQWFKKAAMTAASQGKSDSAALWRDGLEHLEQLMEQTRGIVGGLGVIA